MAIHVGLRHPHTKHSTFPITQLYWRFHATCRRKKVGDESTRSAALMTNRQFSTCFRTLLFSNTKWAILMRFEWKWIGCTFGWLMNSNCNADNNDKRFVCLKIDPEKYLFHGVIIHFERFLNSLIKSSLSLIFGDNQNSVIVVDIKGHWNDDDWLPNWLCGKTFHHHHLGLTKDEHFITLVFPLSFNIIRCFRRLHARIN